MPAKPPAILLGSDCLTGLQIARILWRKGIPVIGIADRLGSPYTHTRAVQTSLPSSALLDPVPLLQEFTIRFGARPVLLACTDAYAHWLSRHRDLVAPHADFLLPNGETLDLLSDKARFCDRLANHALRIPRTYVVKTLDQVEGAGRDLGFPLVVKPPRKTAAWLAASGVAKVCRVEHPDALLEMAPSLLEAVGELVLQAWIEGPDSQSRELSVCLDRDGQPLTAVVFQKQRQWPPDTGTGTLVVEVTDEEVVEQGLALLRELEYVGPGQLEFKRDAADGKLYVIEMNAGRAALNFPLCEASGVEMTETWYAASAGQPLPVARQVTRPGAGWICWKRDLPAVLHELRHGRLTPAAWWRSLRTVEASADLQWDDPVPFLVEGVTRVAQSLGRLTKRLSERARRGAA